jgi:hypothetical protein
LAAQATFFEDLTGDVLRRAGIGPGMHVLDLGCGVGDVSFLAGGMVGNGRALDQISQFPASELFTQVSSWIIASFKAGGAETNMGRRLLSTFLLSGLPRPTMIAASRVESGPDAYAYTYITEILRSLLPLAERSGVPSVPEVAIDTLAERLREDATANDIVAFLPRMVGAWSRLPG